MNVNVLLHNYYYYSIASLKNKLKLNQRINIKTEKYLSMQHHNKP